VHSLAPPILSTNSGGAPPAGPIQLFSDTFNRTGAVIGSSADLPSSALYISFYPGSASGDTTPSYAYSSSPTSGCIVVLNNNLRLPTRYKLTAQAKIAAGKYHGVVLRAQPVSNTFYGVGIQFTPTTVHALTSTSPSSQTTIYSASVSIPAATYFNYEVLLTASTVQILIPSLSFDSGLISTTFSIYDSLGLLIAEGTTTEVDFVNVETVPYTTYTPLLSDSFSGANGSPILGRTPDGGGSAWAALGASSDNGAIVSGRATTSVDGVGLAAVSNVSSTSYVIDSQFILGPPVSGFGLAYYFRATPLGGSLIAQFTNGFFNLYETNSVLKYSVATSLTTGTLHTIRIENTPDGYDIYVNNAFIYGVVSSLYSSNTHVGIFSNRPSYLIDNIIVRYAT